LCDCQLPLCGLQEEAGEWPVVLLAHKVQVQLQV
jgi:hypothetical protein